MFTKKTGRTNNALKFRCFDLNLSSNTEEISAKKDTASPYQAKAQDDKILTTNKARKVLSRFFFWVLIKTKIEIMNPKMAKFKPKNSL